jgi:hypothetical protein
METHEAPAMAEALAAGLVGHATLQRLWLRDLPRALTMDGSLATGAPQAYARSLMAALLADAPALSALHMCGPALEQDVGEPRGALLGALARASGSGAGASGSSSAGAAAAGAPLLRRLSLPAAGLGALSAEDVRAAAPALRSLRLLSCDWCVSQRDRWEQTVDLLNPAAAEEEEDEEEE